VLLEIATEYALFLLGCRFDHFRGWMDREDIAPRRVTIWKFRARTLHLCPPDFALRETLESKRPAPRERAGLKLWGGMPDQASQRSWRLVARR
jgi:hypothetical protein